jgi:DNA polymerase-3 subunit delta'
MPTFFDKIVGNRSLTARISRDIDNGLLSHAYIIEGPMGSGRHTLVRYIAAALSCQMREHNGSKCPCGECRNCKKILSDASPDVITVSVPDDRTTIGVDSIREVREGLYIAPNDLDIKVYVIDNSNLLTTEAQNAFLLSLEDPPEYILFFLICENSTGLLETVRSRAPTLRMERLEFCDIEEYLLKNDERAIRLNQEAPDEFKSAIFSSGGSIGRAQILMDARKRRSVLDAKRTAEEIIFALADASRAKAISAITPLMKKKKNDIVDHLTNLLEAIRDIVLLKKSEDVRLCFFENRDAALELSTRFTSTSLFTLYDAVSKAKLELEANANSRLALTNMLLQAKML